MGRAPPAFVALTPAHRSSSSSSPPTSWASAAAAPCTTSSTSGISTRCPTCSGAPPPPSSPTCPSTCQAGAGVLGAGEGAAVALLLPPSFSPQGAAAGRDRALLEHLPLHGLQLPLAAHLPRTRPAAAVVRHGPAAGPARTPARQEARSPLQEGEVRAWPAGRWQRAPGLLLLPALLPSQLREDPEPWNCAKGAARGPPSGQDFSNKGGFWGPFPSHSVLVLWQRQESCA